MVVSPAAKESPPVSRGWPKLLNSGPGGSILLEGLGREQLGGEQAEALAFNDYGGKYSRKATLR
jgi:hypothetical protein